MGTTRQVPTLLRHIRRLATAQKLAHLSDRELLQRFAGERDEAAFAALVKRHGAMVLHVGQRVLHNGHDAEDVFQATFLVLTRKAGSLRWHESVGNWLYQTAYRIALKVKTSAARRGVKEARAAQAPLPASGRGWGRGSASATAPDDLSWREVETLLDEELHRLPVKYRVPLVFCYLEGSTRDEAAQQLGWSLSTLKRRLERGREMLRLRLVRRGLTFSAALFAPMLTQGTAKAALAPGLVQATLRSALQLTAGQPMAGLASAQVTALVEGGLKTMLATKLKVATALLLAVSVVTGAGVLSHQALAGKPVASQEARAKPPEKTLRVAGAERSEAPDSRNKPGLRRLSPGHPRDELTYSGRVLGSDGKPVSGAKLYMTLHWGYPHYPAPSPEYARSGPDGRFKFLVPKAKFLDRPTVVAAAAVNHGVGWVEVPATGKTDDLTLRLLDDDGPITGQIVDLQGKPVPGATVSLMQINAAPGEDLGPWLEAIKSKKRLGYPAEQEYLKRYTIAVPLRATTDADGRFRLTGIGRNRLVRAQLDGPTIASEHLCILTRPGEAIQVTKFFEGQPESGVPRTTYYGANFRHAAAPTKPIIGLVRDRDTKKPLAGVTIQSHTDIIRTTTDAQGRYRLTGMPKGKDYGIIAIPRSEQPYVVSTRSVADSPGLDPVTVDFQLKRGVWIEGKITDKVTGKPLPASVEYFSLYSNPNLRDYEGFGGDSDFRIIPAKEDGSYRVVAVPGPGLVVVWNLDHYLRAGERDDEEALNETYLKEGTAPYLLPLCNYSAFARINPAKGVDSVKQDVALDPGWTFTGTVVGPDGQPLAGVRAFDLTDRGWRSGELKTAEFTVRAFNPRRPRDVLFLHLEKGLVGVAQPPKENEGSVTVRMEPGAAVTGRLVDANVQPRRNVELKVWFRIKNDSERRFEGYPHKIKTDGDGHFRIQALLPGYEYRLSDGKGELPIGGEFRSGQTKDLGDVQVKAD
jgi:RNA polymerase sigma factor (sigma-70 family)